MSVIIATAIVSIIASVGISAAVTIKITAEIQKSEADFLLNIFEENFKENMKFYKSINEMLMKLDFKNRSE